MHEQQLADALNTNPAHQSNTTYKQMVSLGILTMIPPISLIPNSNDRPVSNFNFAPNITYRCVNVYQSAHDLSCILLHLSNITHKQSTLIKYELLAAWYIFHTSRYIGVN